MSLSDDDFGFTMHDDPGEVDKKWQALHSDEVTRRINEKKKIDEIMRLINPILNNLMKNPDKPYIKWADRVSIIKDIQQQLDAIVERA